MTNPGSILQSMLCDTCCLNSATSKQISSVAKESDKIYKNDWWFEGLTLAKEYSAYRDKFINIPTQFESICE